MGGFFKSMVEGLSGGGHICACCGYRFSDGGAYTSGTVGICSSCAKRLKYTSPPHIFFSGSYTKHIIAPLFYADPLKRVITDMKFSDCSANAALLAQIIYTECGEALKGFDMIIPVPVSDERENERGYNQAELIAEELSRLIGTEYIYNAAIKYKDTTRQSLRVHGRKIEDIDFYFDVSEYVKGLRVLLVDDVHTTGLTMDALAYKAKTAGAEYIAGVAVARKRINTEYNRTSAGIRDRLNAARLKNELKK